METSRKAKVQSSRRPGLVPGLLLRLPRSNASNVLLFQLGVGDQWWTAERTPKRLLPPRSLLPSSRSRGSSFSKSFFPCSEVPLVAAMEARARALAASPTGTKTPAVLERAREDGDQEVLAKEGCGGDALWARGMLRGWKWMRNAHTHPRLLRGCSRKLFSVPSASTPSTVSLTTPPSTPTLKPTHTHLPVSFFLCFHCEGAERLLLILNTGPRAPAPKKRRRCRLCTESSVSEAAEVGLRGRRLCPELGSGPGLDRGIAGPELTHDTTTSSSLKSC
ncbi:hypothetical protein HPB51_003618 [Rhipicephalus microplus]|uniref:Uncharacterized protein n=1 Tax=Rhipicephalus microplus TaxID=6941 RepID=A0A9J6DZJ8_RHIMP|nr:hypothetical protein HPB51_003618 [Rhipicephalus microplus]